MLSETTHEVAQGAHDVAHEAAATGQLGFDPGQTIVGHILDHNSFEITHDFAPPLPPGEWIPFDSESVDAYEVGLKSTLADGTLRLNVGAFTQKYGRSSRSPSPRSGSVWPIITRAASFASGRPMALLTNGAVREARGLASRM